jgi:hypothetical protein
MKAWPFGAALRGEASNRHMLRWLTTVVVSDVEKASKRRQVGTGKTIAVDASLLIRWHRNRGVFLVPGGVWRVPEYWPDGVRRGGDVSPVCGARVELGKADRVTAARCRTGQAARGSVPSGRNREGVSTVAWFAGGPARSSEEVPVMGVERRGRIIRGLFVQPTGLGSGGAV